MQPPLPLMCAQVKLDELEKELQELNGNAERLGRSHAELLELQLVLEVASQFFDDAQHSASSAQNERVDAFGGARSCSWLYFCICAPSVLIGTGLCFFTICMSAC